MSGVVSAKPASRIAETSCCLGMVTTVVDWSSSAVTSSRTAVARVRSLAGPSKSETRIQSGSAPGAGLPRRDTTNSAIPTSTAANASATHIQRPGANAAGLGSGAGAGVTAGGSSASTNSAAVAKRSAGTLAIAFSSAASTYAGTAGRTTRTDGIGSWRWRAMTACTVRLENGGNPVSISNTTHPSA